LKLKRYNDGTKTYKIMFNFSAIQFNNNSLFFGSMTNNFSVFVL